MLQEGCGTSDVRHGYRKWITGVWPLSNTSSPSPLSISVSCSVATWRVAGMFSPLWTLLRLLCHDKLWLLKLSAQINLSFHVICHVFCHSNGESGYMGWGLTVFIWTQFPWSDHPCLHLSSARITGVHHHPGVYPVLRSEPGLPAYKASTLQTELHLQPPNPCLLKWCFSSYGSRTFTGRWGRRVLTLSTLSHGSRIR